MGLSKEEVAELKKRGLMAPDTADRYSDEARFLERYAQFQQAKDDPSHPYWRNEPVPSQPLSKDSDEARFLADEADQYEQFQEAKDDPYHPYWGDQARVRPAQPASGAPRLYAASGPPRLYAASGTPEQLAAQRRGEVASRLAQPSGPPRPIQNDELERKRIMIALMTPTGGGK